MLFDRWGKDTEQRSLQESLGKFMNIEVHQR
jgi:hypothetical protein